MREAIGGTMLMQIVLVFLIVYIFFMAVVINYGRVFRAKNTLITYIEAEEGFKEGGVRSLREKATEIGYTGKIHACCGFVCTLSIPDRIPPNPVSG